MLPATLQFVIAMIACAINERMQRKLDYLAERFHQGIGGQIIREEARATNDNGTGTAIVRRSRLGGFLNYYHREAA